MKYFTTEWWRGGCDKTEFQRYETYLSSVRARLPPELVSFDATHTLHDAEVESVSSDFQAKTLTMMLRGWDRAFHHPVRYTICFEGVSEFRQQLAPSDGLEPDLGEVGYWEFEAHDSSIEIRILFASSAEFQIMCTGFSYTHITGQV